MKKYMALFRIRFSNSLQYRAAALAGLATQFAWGFMLILSYSAFYRSNPSAFPMSFSQTVSYIWLQQAFLTLFAVWSFELDIFETITSGGIAYELSRPLDMYNRWFCQTSANRLARSMLRCFPVLLVAFLVPEPIRMSLPPDAVQFVMFLVSAILGLCVVVAFSMLIYITAFYTLSPVGVRLIAALLADFLAGGIIPLPFFPEPFRSVAELLPFAAMQNAPFRIYSGNLTGGAAAECLALQAIWLAVLVLSGRSLMKKALSKVVVQGG